MQYTDCHSCEKKSIPLNETLNIDGNNYCQECLERDFNTEESLKGREIKENIDDTICFSCQKGDFLQPLEKIGTYPVCVDCKQNIRNREFPLWVKGFFIVVLGLVVFSFYWNWKYYDAYKDINQAYLFAGEGDFGKAHESVHKAAEIVPDVQDVRLLDAYFTGLDYLQKDSSVLALQQFEILEKEPFLPEELGMDYLILQARMGTSFDNENYEAFLNYSKEYFELDSPSTQSLSVMASAHACMYASSNKDSEKKLALEFLEKAKAIDNESEEALGYYNRIEHRIYTKKIIPSEEFNKHYPNGWQKN